MIAFNKKEIIAKVKSKLADTSAVRNKKLIWTTLVSSNLQPTEVVNIGRSVLALSFSDKIKEDEIEESLNKIGYTIKVHKPKYIKDLRTKESVVQYEVSKKI